MNKVKVEVEVKLVFDQGTDRESYVVLGEEEAYALGRELGNRNFKRPLTAGLQPGLDVGPLVAPYNNVKIGVS